MKYTGEVLYSARYMQDAFGIPEQLIKEKCKPVGGLFRLKEARAVFEKYKAEKKRKHEMFMKLQSEHRCVHRIGYEYCGKPAIMNGYPYCEKHLPPSVFNRNNLVGTRNAFRSHGKCIAEVDGGLCGDPVVAGKLRCAKHLEELKKK
jgi:hypothetical protein